MIKIHKEEQRYSADHGWLKSNFSFSFADYYDPNNMQFSVLRVLNDDIVAPMKGFPTHPHREMEIVSIVLEGSLKHEDSKGHQATTSFGGIQRMSAGTGIMHSEFNPSKSEDVHLLQLWFLPEKEGITPSYEQTEFSIEKLQNSLLPVVAKKPISQEVASIHQDLTIYLSDLEENKELTFKQEEGRNIYIFVIEGTLQINEDTFLNERDDARISDLHEIKIKANQKARFMLIDLP